jgi:hypothetical protein
VIDGASGTRGLAVAGEEWFRCMMEVRRPGLTDIAQRCRSRTWRARNGRGFDPSAAPSVSEGRNMRDAQFEATRARRSSALRKASSQCGTDDVLLCDLRPCGLPFRNRHDIPQTPGLAFQ